MFTIEQIHEISARVKSGADFPRFVQDLKTLGVTHYDTQVSEGRSSYYGDNHFELHAEPKYPPLPVSSESSADKLKQALAIHQQGQTDYPTFCRQAAEAGVEKWTTDMIHMTVTYLDKKGKALLVEPIPGT